ncbi:DMT family transporter [Oligella ureolytica]
MSSTLRQYPMWVGVVTLILSIISLCTGTSFAKTLFTEVGAIGTTTFRIFSRRVFYG